MKLWNSIWLERIWKRGWNMSKVWTHAISIIQEGITQVPWTLKSTIISWIKVVGFYNMNRNMYVFVLNRREIWVESIENLAHIRVCVSYISLTHQPFNSLLPPPNMTYLPPPHQVKLGCTKDCLHLEPLQTLCINGTYLQQCVITRIIYPLIINLDTRDTTTTTNLCLLSTTIHHVLVYAFHVFQHTCRRFCNIHVSF